MSHIPLHMNTNRTLLLIILACIVIAAGIYGAAYLKRQHPSEEVPAPSAPSAKVAAANAADGTYVAQVHAITVSPEDTTVTFTPVIYIDGDEATSTAEAELSCEDQPIAACAPTLTRGYYVRKSGEPDFTAPVVPDTRITLHDDADADILALKGIHRQFDPVFEVVITNGAIARIAEKSPL